MTTSASNNTAAPTLSGKWLRWTVCLLLQQVGRPMTIAELVHWLEGNGYTIGGDRPGKSVSDALRWEVARGRVVQVGRGRYGPGPIERSTAYSMRKRVLAWRAEQTSPRTTSLPAASWPSSTCDTDPTALMPRTEDGFIDFDKLDTSDAWSGPAPAVFLDDL